MNKDGIWIENFPIRSFDSDLNGKCKLTSLLQFFQEVAWHHAEYCGFGYSDLMKNNQFWVLSGLTIEVYEYPDWDDIIQVYTWPKGMERLFALRDFCMKKNGKTFCNGTTNWLILDIKTYRPQKPEIVFNKFIDFIAIDAIREMPAKISLPDIKSNTFQIEASYSDVDVNKHVNNVKYIEWTLDVLYNQLIDNKVINKLTINFISESKINDIIQLFVSKINSGIYIVSAKNLTTNKEVYRIQMEVC
ncbi:acyl-[acyl-carrier-protein] thioesterase [Bacteroidota bacterium]